MVQDMGRLTVKQVENAKPGYLSDGDRLYLLTKPNGSRYWAYRYTSPRGKKREAGLGSVAIRTLKEAREIARIYNIELADGIDPIEKRKSAKLEQRAARTFSELAHEYVAKQASGWRSPRQASIWLSSLDKWVNPVIGDKLLGDITLADAEKALRSGWESHTETLKRVRGRCEKIYDYGVYLGLSAAPNPFKWVGTLSNALPDPAKIQTVVNHPSMPWQELPSFYKSLHEVRGTSALCLRWILLTACRSGEARLTTWGELDIANRVWNLPGDRTKTGDDNRLPITYQMLRTLVLARRLSNGSGYVFPSPIKGGALSDMAVLNICKEHCPGYVPHGFRASFSTGIAEQGVYALHLIEAQLSHRTGSKVALVYRRTDFLDQRRPMMRDWSKYLAGSGQL